MNGRPDGERLHPLTGLARAWLLLVFLVWRAVRRIEFDAETLSFTLPETAELIFLAVIAGVFLLITVLGGISAVRNTRFRLAEERLEVDTAWISRSSRSIPYRSIDSVNISRPLSARLLGLAKVRVEAGENETVLLEYLSLRRAEELRDELLELGDRQRGDGVRDGTDPSSGNAAEAPPEGEAADVGEATDEARKARDGDLIVAIASTRVAQARLRSFLPLVIVVTAAIAVWILLVLDRPSWLFGVGIAVVGAVGNWVWGIVKAGTAELRLRGTTLTLREGRFDDIAQTVGISRVLSVEVDRPLPWRRLGLYTVTLHTLGKGGGDEDSGNPLGLSLRAATWEEVRLVIAAVMPGQDVEALLTRRLPARARDLHPFAVRSLRWGYNDDALAIREGRLFPPGRCTRSVGCRR